jgi:hypothetical protein
VTRLWKDDPEATKRALIARAGQPGVIVPGRSVQDDSVRHVCPECGGITAENQGAHLVVQLCKVCWGDGTLSLGQLDAYMGRLAELARAEELRNGTA